jgi:lycopene cyclase CruA
MSIVSTMNYLYSDYVELPAPISLVITALQDPLLWAELPIGAERLGQLWRSGAELYQVLLNPAGTTLSWQISPATGIGRRIDLDIDLHDALISTHARVRVRLSGPGPLWPWARPQLHTALRQAIRKSTAKLTELLRTRAAELLLEPLEAVVAPLAVRAGPASELVERSEAAATPLRPGLGSHLAKQLAERYPQTVRQFAAMGALDHLERVWRLEQGWERMMRGSYDEGCYQLDPGAAPAAAPTFDLIYAGGGLGLLHAAVMAKRYGRKVLVFDRGEVGCAHREWNISRPELQALVDLGVVSWGDLANVVMREYRDGLVRFYNGPASDVKPFDLWLPEVLNVALDAGALLQLMRHIVEDAGGKVLSHRAFSHVKAFASGPAYVEVQLDPLGTAGASERYSARLLLDGMGSTSPLALLRHAGQPFAGVCPTVGTVADGFAKGSAPDEYDPNLGDILLSVADAQLGEQLMWEGFPGRADELTVYLFYYATIPRSANGQPAASELPASKYSLLALFEQYFALLPSYKRPGPHFRQIKPVYGYIPARHSLRANEAPLLRGVLPVGDSAAQQSPLTFCGFGSHVRNLDRTTSLLDFALDHDLLDERNLRHVNAFQVNVSLNWVFSRFMHPWDQPHNVNRLQNIFLETLHELGVDMATRFFQDRMRWADYHPMILGTLRRFHQIIPISWSVLGPAGWLQWASDYAHFSSQAAQAALARALGPHGEHTLRALADRRSPSAGMAVRARYAEWRAMDWLSK